MESHARTVDITTHNYYDVLYAFHVFRGNFRKGMTIKRHLFHTYWDFRIKFCFVKKRFGVYVDQSERRNEFLIREKIVSSNHKQRLKRIVFSRAFSRSSRVALSGSFDKIFYYIKVSGIASGNKLIKTIRYPHMWRYDIFTCEDIDDFGDIKFVS